MELRLKEDLGSVRLWRVGLDVEAAVEARLRDELSADELERAEGFSSEPARRRYVVTRGTLRTILGSLLGEAPRSIRIEASPGGKPRLAGDEPGLRFNVSHAGDLALICVADRELGVDLEAIRPVPSALAIARRRFSPAEARFVEEGPADELDRRFLLCWARKEALLKAAGTGLVMDLRAFTVPLSKRGGLASTDSASPEHQRSWQIAGIPIGGHVAAVALRVPD